MHELPPKDGSASLQNEIIELWSQIQANREQRMTSALPEACKRECSIAKLVISRVMEEGTKSELAHKRLSECTGFPHTVGECGTTKRVCSHTESGDTVNFAEQINNLYDYVQKED